MNRRILLIAGARPNFIKIAPVHKALSAVPGFDVKIIHTGQHYDREMSHLFFDQLGIPEPDINLGVGSGTHAEQTAQIMRSFEKVVLDESPDMVMVVGDVNSTVACSLVAKKFQGIDVAHVEAGLRSNDRTMPEEINRLVTDAISDILFTSERSGDRHLRAEGVPDEKIVFVGNVMIDTLQHHLERARETGTVAELGLKERGYGLLTLHRPANVDDPTVFAPMMEAISRISESLPLVFPIHPRTRAPYERWCADRGSRPPGIRVQEPLGYLEFMHLTSSSSLVLTDSGGIQEETTVLGIPCLTLRDNTERPVTVDEGSNILVGRDPEAILSAATETLAGRGKKGSVPEGWDGRAAERIAAHLRSCWV